MTSPNQLYLSQPNPQLNQTIQMTINNLSKQNKITDGLKTFLLKSFETDISPKHPKKIFELLIDQIESVTDITYFDDKHVKDDLIKYIKGLNNYKSPGYTSSTKYGNYTGGGYTKRSRSKKSKKGKKTRTKRKSRR